MTRHFGALVPSTNTTVEIEYNRLLPDTLQLHAARLGKPKGIPFAPGLDADVAYQSKMLGNARVETLCLTQTSASLFEDGYDARIKKLMEDGANAPAVTSAEAIGEACRALGAQRVCIVTPYSEDVINRAQRYYETNFGLDVVSKEAFGATDAYAIGRIDANAATDAFARIDRPEIEALILPGGAFQTMRHIAAWEERFGKPVISTNQAALWAMLRIMKVAEPLPGLGRLLAQKPAG
jgi:maleate cis-trans isomerase